ncbi:sugar ABC transporter substrate-binding protein [Pelolinea submarina]|uniref:Monosaccharide ABC transporter substrate-binding protein (CUT2 family) n=1 Tax=Pelolinea submarina TaxID=913107 RepID=A0A347ZR16_9CHLR|nr:sugar ABC transporter substrate-binding protein [Pelolinea submarina]REG11699.1 monosaccharide ABC transporter substrate-binding protein (CUT2 family) [Pelolinea submarina]BBB47747.1 inositol transport system substrate-binding protein [Pelolinea submarina]
MKRITFVTILVLVGLIAACAPAASAPAEEAPAAEQPAAEEVAPAAEEAAVPVPPSKKVAWVASNIANEFTTGMAANAESVGAEHGWEVTVFNPDSDLSKQISQLENAGSQGYAAIIFDPVAYDGMTAVVEELTSSYDIPVITLHGSCSAQDLLTAFVAINIQEGGRLKMEQVAKDLNGKGDIAIMTGTEGQTTAIFITDGYYEVLPEYPDINVVFTGAGNWNADDATPLAENWLSSGKNLDAIVCNNDGMALGVRAVLQAAGLTGQIKLYGLDATPEGRKAIRDGSMNASIWVDSHAEFVAAFDIIDAFYAGEPFEKEVMIAPTLVTKDNIDELFPND